VCGYSNVFTYQKYFMERICIAPSVWAEREGGRGRRERVEEREKERGKEGERTEERRSGKGDSF
jgi:hypothetical protein